MLFRILFTGLVFLAVLLAVSCKKQFEQFDTSRIKTTTWNPTLGIPLVTSQMGVSDIFGNADTNAVSSDPTTGLVVLAYESSELEISANEFVSLPVSQEFTQPNVPLVPGQSVIIQIPFSLSSGSSARIDKISFREGQILIHMNASSGSVAKWEFLSITKDGQALNKSIAMNQQGVADLAGYEVAPNSQGNIEVKVTIPQGVSGTANPSFNITGLKFERFEGFTGSGTIALPRDSIKLHLFRNISAQGFLKLDNPSLRIDYDNGFNLSLKMDLSDMSGYNTVNYQHHPVFQGSGNGEFTVSPDQKKTIRFDKSNSDLSEVIQPTPTYLSLQPKATPNPGGGSTTNIIHFNDSFRLKAMLELPLAGYVKDVVIRDTVPVGLSQNFDLIREMGLRSAIKNGFPFNISLSMQLLDSSYNPVLTAAGAPVMLMKDKPIFTSEVAPAYPNKIDQTQLQERIEDYTLTQEIVDVILQGHWIIIEAKIQTEGNGSKTIGIFDDYTLDVKLGARIVGDIKIGS